MEILVSGPCSEVHFNIMYMCMYNFVLLKSFLSTAAGSELELELYGL